jgi:hypothetical protein
MKNFFSLLFLGLLCSCSNSFYHVASVHSEQVKRIDRDFAVEDEHLKVVYNLWEEGGRMRFLLFNKTDQPLYIDWSKSVLMRNDNTIPYTQLPPPAEGAEAAADTVRYFYQHLPAEPYRRTARGNQFTEVPPHAIVAIADFPIQQTVLHKNTKEKLVTYTKQNSPLRVGQQLTYSLDKTGTNPHRIEHSFWVDTIQVMRSDDLPKLYGSLQKGQPNAFYSVEHRVAGARAVIITLAVTTGVIMILRPIVNSSIGSAIGSMHFGVK